MTEAKPPNRKHLRGDVRKKLFAKSKENAGKGWKVPEGERTAFERRNERLKQLEQEE